MKSFSRLQITVFTKKVFRDQIREEDLDISFVKKISTSVLWRRFRLQFDLLSELSQNPLLFD